jgi:predicted PurR-regulated permease PerM
MLNEIEGHLGNYLLMVTTINIGIGVVTGLICAVTGMPNPAGLGALAAILNFVPIIGPVAMFAVLVVVGQVAFPSIGAGLLAPILFAAMTFKLVRDGNPLVLQRKTELNTILTKGSLSTRMMRGIGNGYSLGQLLQGYHRLANCLAQNKMFEP